MNAGMLLPATAVRHPWTFITSMFLHQPTSLWHILFNMLTLWCVGPVLERMMGIGRTSRCTCCPDWAAAPD